MAQKKGKRTLITTLSVLFVLLIAIGTIALVKALNSDNPDPYIQDTSSTSDSEESTNQDEATDEKTNTEQNEDQKTNQPDDEDSAVELDPATVGTIDIPPMDITVSYVKGVGGFEYEVLRANNGTRYVEFRNESLVGTKCTNDMGTFASIIANPTESERLTLAKTQKVGDMTYGLSLADGTCTSDKSLLQEYQSSFSDAFSLLKQME